MPKKPTSRTPARKTSTIAATADRNDLYQRAVQCVESEIDFVDETFTKLRKRKAALLREDFCGTYHTACEWVRRRPTNVAVGIDLDPNQIAWGTAHNLTTLKPAQQARVLHHQGNVLDPLPAPVAAAANQLLAPKDRRKGGGGGGGGARFDVVLAMNFSYWCFNTRDQMLTYFRAAREALVADGILFMDFYGGADALKEMTERRKIAREPLTPHRKQAGWYNGPYTYLWEQERYNPITGLLISHIGFKFPDGSRLKRAFSYQWRLWTLPELRDILHEAGFIKTTVHWEGDDAKGGGNGIFTPSEDGDACPSYICYITAER